jgi:glutathione peroxidase
MSIRKLAFIFCLSVFLCSSTLYDITLENAKTGKNITFSDYKGKLILITNIASKCSFVSQLDGIQDLHQKYQKRGLVVIAIPTNDFGESEPGLDHEIVHFCETNYGTSFTIAAKCSCIGDFMNPLFKQIRKDFPNGQPEWNYFKYFYSPEGKPIGWFHTTVEPSSDEIISFIEKHLPVKK